MPPAEPQTLVLFGRDHLAAIAATVAVTAAACLLLRGARGRPAEPTLRRTICHGLAGALLACAILGDIRAALDGTWNLRETLPLHLCDLAGFAAIVALILMAEPRAHAALEPRRATLSDRACELTYFWGLGGTTQAFLTPEISDAYPSAVYFLFFILHGGILAAAFILVLGLGYRPRPASLWRVWWTTIAVAAVVLGIDLLLGANYMYLTGPPKRASLYDYLGPWPLSLASLVLVGTLVFLLLYAPFWLYDRVARPPSSTPAHTPSRDVPTDPAVD